MVASHKVIFLLIRLTYKGIQLLKEIPDEIPEVLSLQLIPSENLEDIPKLSEHLKPKYQIWWRDWLNDQPLPSTVVPEGNIPLALSLHL